MKRPYKQNLLGKQFNHLLVIKIGDNRKEGKTTWNCECVCGNIKKDILTFDLTKGKVKSCGCLQFPRGELNKSWKGYKKISMRYWSSLKRAARNRNINFNISIEEAWDIFEKQNGKCAITGVDLVFEISGRTSATASIDRIDSKKPYTIDNIQWVHKWINIMKWDLTSQEFIDMCRLVVEHNK